MLAFIHESFGSKVSMATNKPNDFSPDDPGKRHLDVVALPEKSTWMLLRDTPHQFARAGSEGQMVASINLRPKQHENDSGYCLGYSRKLPQQQVLHEFASLNFAHDERRLDEKNNHALREQAKLVLEYLQQHPNTEIQVNGYASSAGDARYNQRLSDDRAIHTVEMLRNCLPEEYADRVKIRYQGLGETQASGNAHYDRRVAMQAINSGTKRHEHVVVNDFAYAALADRTFDLDLGRGSVSQKIYGQLSEIEASTTLCLTQPSSPLQQPAKFNVVVEDIANLRLVVQAHAEKDRPTMMITSDKQVNIYQHGVHLAQVNITGPDGSARDLDKLELGMVQEKGKVVEIVPVKAQGLMERLHGISPRVEESPLLRPLPPVPGQASERFL